MRFLITGGYMKRKRVEIHLDQNQYGELLVMSIELDLAISDIVRSALSDQLTTHKKNSTKFTELRNLILTNRNNLVNS